MSADRSCASDRGITGSCRSQVQECLRTEWSVGDQDRQGEASLIKIIEKGSTIAAPIGPATIEVTLSLDGGTNQYCMRFTGTSDRNKFLVKDAVAGSCSSSPCEGSTGGYCWFLADSLPGADGSSTCAMQGQTYDDSGTRGSLAATDRIGTAPA